MKFVRFQFSNFFLFDLHLSVIDGTIIFLYDRHSRSFLSIIRTLIQDKTSSADNFRVDTSFFCFNCCFTLLIAVLVHTIRRHPGDLKGLMNQFQLSHCAIFWLLSVQLSHSNHCNHHHKKKGESTRFRKCNPFRPTKMCSTDE